MRKTANSGAGFSFNLFGIPVRVDITFWIMAGVLGADRISRANLLIEWMVVVFASILIHELGHALMARAFGQKTRIELYSMGGLTYWSGKPISPGRRILISLAGPVAGFITGAVVLVVNAFAMPHNNVSENLMAKVAVDDLLWVNIGWGVLNLVPVLPLDGGSVVASIEEWLRPGKGSFYSYAVSLAASVAIAIAGIATGYMWFAILGAWFGFNNWQVLSQLRNAGADQHLRPEFNELRDAVTQQRWDDVATISTRIVQAAKKNGSIKREAMWWLTYALIQLNRLDEARRELNHLSYLFGAQDYLEAIWFMRSGQPEQAISLLRGVYQKEPRREVGVLLGTALVQAGRLDEALALATEPALADEAVALYLSVQTAAFALGQYDLAARAGQSAFQARPDAMVAYNLACTYARSGDVTTGWRWLERAVDLGFSNTEQLATDPDLAPLRALPQFDALLQGFPNYASAALSE
jgi:Zn-dependent protease